ncbi:DEAD/DEAH box helicase family protein [uncultured Roseobacter sp.]|uniref:DEAD/DEAH box helicase n=1 Tax=uncultured Roseobacter sp. TaxID=114847 RepID=UPI00261FF88E|nr:DEAD/DEAH box helicase family protein [uncultured Roseobacter sp.]
MSDLFEEVHPLTFPSSLAWDGKVLGAEIRQIGQSRKSEEVALVPFAQGRLRGVSGTNAEGRRYVFIDRKTTIDLDADEVFLVKDAGSTAAIVAAAAAGKLKRLLPKPSKSIDMKTKAVIAELETSRSKWQNGFRLRAEKRNEDGAIIEPGLRMPQIGAVHATLAHWTVSDKPATVVMPTGTGKTETMLALKAISGIRRLMIVVPNDALRTQIAEKALKLGVLKTCGCLPTDAPMPIVAKLNRIPKTVDEVDEIFQRADILITTMNVASGSTPEVQARMAAHVSHLFIDEAHHVPAKTWRRFRSHFLSKNVLQFTATPFREDRARVDGRPIYNYPLWKAQADGYFKKVVYIPINGVDISDSDRRIVEAVGEQLQADVDVGYPHLVMVRGSSKERAADLHRLYLNRYPQWAPLLIHSGIPAAEKTEIIRRLRAHESRIVVCVDMLKEGFDLPDLKIAALHDKQKSEAVTLQFVGRFTRTRDDLGDATVIANLALGDVNESLKRLYAEDADWDKLLSVIGGEKTATEIRREELFQNFPTTPERFPLETLFPRMSTVVYKTTCEEWSPYKIDQNDEAGAIVEGPHINEADRLVVYVQRDFDQPKWTTVRQFQNREYNLFLLHWDPDTGLLYVHSSRLKELHEPLARLVCGEDVQRITGEGVFRALHGFKRLLLNNLGLSETQRRPVRHSNFMGTDITPQVDTLPGNQNRIKTNLFGQGYTDDGKSTIGCSRKGKFWSYEKTNNFAEWIDWCHVLGAKLIDEAIPTDAFLRNLIKPKKIEQRPEKTPIAIMWPEGILDMMEDRIELHINGVAFPIFDCDIELQSYQPTGPILFNVGADNGNAAVAMTIDVEGAHYGVAPGTTVDIKIGNKLLPLAEWFKDDPPHIYFGDGDMLLDNELFPLPAPADHDPFDLEKIDTWDWTGTNIRKESQGPGKDVDSIQRRVIVEMLASGRHDVIYDDDGSGEAADVIAIRKEGRTLRVEFVHCKFSNADAPGARVDDLYQVLGQAQKSVRWREFPKIFLQHLRTREARRLRSGGHSRYELGDAAIVNGWLAEWNDMSYEFSIAVVQPGYSKANANEAHLRLLAATEAFLMETWGIPFRMICST